MSKLSKLCKGIGWTIVVLCIIATLAIAVQVTKISDNLGAFFIALFIGAIITLLLPLMLFVVGEILARLANIEYNLYAIANRTYANSAKDEAREKLLDNGGWRCNQCGKINQGYIGTCVCGNAKHSR